MPKQPLETTIGGVKYTIGAHRGLTKIPLGKDVSALILPESSKKQKALFDSMSAAQRKKAAKALQDAAQEGVTDREELGKLLMSNLDMSKIDLAKLTEMAGTAFDQLSGDEFLDLSKRLLSETFCADGSFKDDNVIDAHFTDHYANLTPLLAAIIEYNGFLDLNLQELM